MGTANASNTSVPGHWIGPLGEGFMQDGIVQCRDKEVETIVRDDPVVLYFVCALLEGGDVTSADESVLSLQHDGQSGDRTVAGVAANLFLQLPFGRIYSCAPPI